MVSLSSLTSSKTVMCLFLRTMGSGFAMPVLYLLGYAVLSKEYNTLIEQLHVNGSNCSVREF